MVTDIGIAMFNLSKSIMAGLNWQYTEIECLLLTFCISSILLIAVLEFYYLKLCNDEWE